jgi:hypothetical protein
VKNILGREQHMYIPWKSMFEVGKVNAAGLGQGGSRNSVCPSAWACRPYLVTHSTHVSGVSNICQAVLGTRIVGLGI